MILEKDPHGEHIRRGIHDAEKDLLNYHGFLPRGDGEERRHRSLLAIVEQAGKLQVEVYRQVSTFKLRLINPGSRYDPTLMDDISSLADEDEAGTQTFLVKVVIFPPVLRWGFHEDGKFSDEVVVRKGTVITICSEDYEVWRP